VRRLILLNTQPGELILDPFGGIGNTLVESVREKRLCHSIDISAEYTRQAQRRLEQIELEQRLFHSD
jgi:DNA modification methylase